MMYAIQLDMYQAAAVGYSVFYEIVMGLVVIITFVVNCEVKAGINCKCYAVA